MRKVARSIEFEKIEKWIDSGIDLDNRVIELGDIDELSNDIIRAFKLMEKESSKPITIVVSSFGGCVYTGLRFYDLLNNSKCKIITRAEGYVMSMGTIIYLAGDERYALPNTTFMFHEVSTLGLGKLSELKNTIQESDRLENICLEIMASKTFKDKKWWTKETKHVDKFMDVETCRKLGVITHESR